MKTFSQSILFSVCLFASTILHAVPMQYSFNGAISLIQADSAATGFVYTDTLGDSINFDGSIFTVGDNINYEFLIDFAQPGQCIDPNGITGADCDASGGIPDAPGIDYFYVELLSASISTQLTWDDTFLNYGLGSWVFGESAIWLEGTTQVADWDVGTQLTGFDDWLSTTGNEFGRVTSNMTLTSIQPIAVPEPATLLLFAAGLFLLYRRPFIQNAHKPAKTSGLL